MACGDSPIDRGRHAKPLTMARLRIDKRLKSDFAWMLSGNVLYSACQWSAVLVFAKLGSPEQVGEYALGVAISAPIVLFANLQLRALVASDVKNQFSFGQYLTLRMISLGAALLVLAGVVACTQANWRLGGIIILVGLGQALEFISETYYGLMQKYERMDRLSRSLMLKGPLSLAALCAVFYATRSVVWALVALTLGRLIVLLAWDSRLAFAGKGAAAPAVRLEWNATIMRHLLRLALPLGMISMLGSLNSSVPRFFIEAHCGSAELGIFSAIASLLNAGTLVVSALGQSIFVPVAKAYEAADRARYRDFVLQAAALGGFLGGAAVLAAALFGRQILTRIFRPEYGKHADIFVWLMIAGTITFIASGLGYVMTAARSLRPQIPLLLATAFAAAATSAWSIPRNGLRGAVDAALVAAVVQLAGTGVILFKIDRQLQGNTDPAMALGGPVSPERGSVKA
jgi:O-antigen/teichoic acid export membrane protein